MKLVQDVPNDAPNGVKRSAEDEDEDADADEDEDAHGEIDDEVLNVSASNSAYNTRFKGVKRVKMEREGPELLDRTPQRRRGRPRKSAPAALIEAGTNKSGTAAVAAAQASGSMVDPQQPVKRRRGRPRKNPIPPAPENVSPHKSSATNSPSSKRSGGPPDSRGRQIFDGVVLPQRPKKALVAVSLHPSVSRSGLSPDHHDPDADADGDMDAEAEEAAWVHSSTVQNSDLAGTEQGM